jgi:transcriptional regulator with XRE-family HTH domain
LIKQRRAEIGFSRRKLATRVSVSGAYIAQMETRERTNTSLNVLRLAKALKVSIAELVA